MRHLIHVCLLLLAAITTQAQNATPTDPKVITGMVLLNDKKVPDFNKISEELPQNWYVKVDSLTISGKTMLFSTAGATVMLAYLDYPVNPEEIQIASVFPGSGKRPPKKPVHTRPNWSSPYSDRHPKPSNYTAFSHA